MVLSGGVGFSEEIYFRGIILRGWNENESIWPRAILHFLHDFCSWIGNDMVLTSEIVLVAVQKVVMLAYMIYLISLERKRGQTA